MIHDLEQIERTVLQTDPGLRAIDRDDIHRHMTEARQHARAQAKDDFLLSLMRLMALPGNGHTRLTPNAAIFVLPLRFATIGSAVRLLDAPSGLAGTVGGELISINGMPVGEIECAAETFLAGTPQRKRVIGPILFVWPGALARLGVWSGNGTIEYLMRDAAGQIGSFVPDTSDAVRGSALYPQNEHGKADASWSAPTYLEIRDFGRRGYFMALPSFFDSAGTELPKAIAEAADRARLHPDAPLLIDVRGNTGGNFLRTMPLIDAISAGGENRRVGVLVDKFTFSAAIVFVPILKHRLGAQLTLVGEEMGDSLTFFAEGGTCDLSTGAAVRFASAFHDWATGRTDETTPREIADRIVAVGSLELDRTWVANSDDVETRDWFCGEVLEILQA